ncbi:MAG: fibronectin type III domain-containing protein [Anaerolineae bacterium]|nr:fibronectin type III domain-containing protein [Anaerolineae bacterium]
MFNFLNSHRLRVAIGLSFMLVLGLTSFASSLPATLAETFDSPLDGSEKVVLQEKVYPDGALDFQIILRNSSDSNVLNVQVTDALHPRLDLVAATVEPNILGTCSEDVGVVTCNLMFVPPSSPVTLTLQTQVKSESFVIGTDITNTATISDSTNLIQTNVVTATMANFEKVTSQVDDPWNNQFFSERGTYTIKGRAWSGATHPAFPETPVLHPITYTTGNNWYFVTWGKITDAFIYILEESKKDPHFMNPTEVSTSEQSYYAEGKSIGTYYYRVRARNVTGESRWSNVVSVTVASSTRSAFELEPTVPALVVAADTPHIEVNIKQAGAADNWITVTNVTAASGGDWWDWTYDWELPVFNDDTGYVIQTRAKMASGNYGDVDTIAVTIRNGTRYVYMPLVVRRWPPVPYSTTLDAISNTDGDNVFMLTWVYGNHPDAPATSYTLQQAKDEAFTTEVVNYAGIAALSYQVTVSTPGVYYYRVRAFNSYGQGPVSNARSITILPRAPVMNAIDNADEETSYTVSWAASWGAAQYLLWESTSSDMADPQLIYNGTDLSYPVSDKESGTYYYMVVAAYGDIMSGWSNIVSTSVVAGYSDDFSDDDSGWRRGSYKITDDDGDEITVASSWYESNTYRMKILLNKWGVNNRRMEIIRAPYQHFDDTYDVQVEHKFVRADDQSESPIGGKAGLIFRADYSSSKGVYTKIYVFEWNFEGECEVHKYWDIDSAVVKVDLTEMDPELGGWRYTDCTSGGYDHRVYPRAEVRGSKVTFYMGDTKITSLSGVGSNSRLGLITGSWDYTPVESLFDNFEVIDK